MNGATASKSDRCRTKPRKTGRSRSPCRRFSKNCHRNSRKAPWRPLARVYACASTRYQYPRESPLYFPPLHHCRQRPRARCRSLSGRGGASINERGIQAARRDQVLHAARILSPGSLTFVAIDPRMRARRTNDACRSVAWRQELRRLRRWIKRVAATLEGLVRFQRCLVSLGNTFPRCCFSEGTSSMLS